MARPEPSQADKMRGHEIYRCATALEGIHDAFEDLDRHPYPDRAMLRKAFLASKEYWRQKLATGFSGVGHFEHYDWGLLMLETLEVPEEDRERLIEIFNSFMNPSNEAP